MTALIMRGGLRLLLLVTVLLIFTIEIGRLFIPGEQISYVGGQRQGVLDIFLMDVDRRLALNVTQAIMPEPARNRSPVWSPDGRRLAFSASWLWYSPIVIFDFHTGEIQPLNPQNLDALVDETDPVWSPDGQAIAYTFREEVDRSVYIQSIFDRSLRQLAQYQRPRGMSVRPVDDRLPAFSPDGRWVAFIGGGINQSDIFIVDSSGAQFATLTRGMQVMDDPLSWSPDGNHLLFVSFRDGNRELYTVNTTNASVLNLSRHPSTDTSPRWSPDGTQIAFVSDRDGDLEIYVMDRTGGNIRQLTHNTHYDTAPVWSPDGTALLYISAVYQQTEIFRLDVAMGTSKRLTFNNYSDMEPGWRP